MNIKMLGQVNYAGKIVSSQKQKKNLTGSPMVDFEEGGRRYIKWYMENVK